MEGNSDMCYNMDIEGIMLSERSHIAGFQLYEVLRVVKFIETKVELNCGCQGLE